MYDDLSLEHFMIGLRKRNPGEIEFHQAVYEVAESVIPFILENPKYQKATGSISIKRNSKIVSIN